MAQISHADKEIKLKLVYYGPALSGKTTNLIYIHQVLFPNQKVKLFSINTGDDRTLFFDLLPLDLGVISGFRLKLQLFTVPGQVRYNQTRRAVLGKSDGVVFVADSTRAGQDANAESFDNLKENLKINRLEYDTIPLILQYNKQDMDDIHTPRDLDGIYNERGIPSFGAIAVTGVGVLQTLRQGILQVLGAFNQEFPEYSVTEIEEKIDRSFEAVMEAYQRKTRPAPGAPPEAEEPPPLGKMPGGAAHNVRVMEGRDDISQSKLLEKAVETNIEMAELYNELNASKTLLEQRNRELTILGQISQALTESFDPEIMPRMIFKSILMTFQTAHGSMLEYHANGKDLAEKYIMGFNRDPLNHVVLDDGRSAAHTILSLKRPISFNIFSFGEQPLSPQHSHMLAGELRKFKIMAFMSAPLKTAGLDFGLLVLYQMINENSVLKSYGTEEIHFLGRLSSPMSVSLERLVLSRRISESEREAEAAASGKVKEIQEMNRFLSKEIGRLRRDAGTMDTIVRPLVRADMKREAVLRSLKSDLGKPASSLQMALKLLDKVGTSNQENLEKLMGVIRDESSKINRLLQNMGSTATRFFEEGDFVTEDFSLAELVAEVKACHDPIYKGRRLEWRDSIPGAIPPIRADREKFRFVIDQLLENAERNTSDGFVELKVQYDPVYNDRFLVLSVADSGAGISRENLPRVFERYYRVGIDDRGERPRYGLGLALCKEIVEAFGGRIWAKSEEGIGTTIFFEMPLGAG